MKKTGIFVTALALNVSAVVAIPLSADQSHSSVEFQVKHLASNVTGRFEEFSGSFDFDLKKADMLKDVQFKISTKSINTSNKKRDEHLRSPDFFNEEKFKEITFVSKTAKKIGKNKFELTGDMTLKGVTKPAKWEVEYLGKAENPFVKGEEVVSFSAKTKINRKDFDMTWNKALDKGGFILGDEVSITVNVEANPAKETKS